MSSEEAYAAITALRLLVEAGIRPEHAINRMVSHSGLPHQQIKEVQAKLADLRSVQPDLIHTAASDLLMASAVLNRLGVNPLDVLLDPERYIGGRETL